MTNKDFGLWLIQEMDKRGWSYSETARRGGISHARISQVVGGDKPGKAFCIAISKAFGIRIEEVLRRAEYLPPDPPETARRREADYLFSRLTSEEQETLLVQMRALAERRAKYEAGTETT